MTVCTGFDCERPSRDAYLCKACTRELERRLSEMPARIDDLITSLTRQTRTAEQSGRSNTPVLVVDLDASRVLAELRACLHKAVTRLCDAGEHIPCKCGHAHVQHHVVVPFLRRCQWGTCVCPGYRPTEDFQIRTMAQWLAYRVKAVRLDETAARFLDDVQRITARLVHQIDLPDDKRTIPVGPCPELNGCAEPCPGEIRAHIPREDDKPALMRCTVCGVEYPTWQWRRAGERIRPRPRPVPPAPVEVPDGSVKGGRHSADQDLSVLDGTMFP